MYRIARWYVPLLLGASTLWPSLGSGQATSIAPLRVEHGDRIVFIGNTFAERMALFPHFEAALTARFPEAGLTFRNLGWSGDEITLQPRPLNFGDLHTHLSEQRADVIFAFFGTNESFAGTEGIAGFRRDLSAFLSELRGHRYNGASPPRLVLVSPIAHERVQRVPLDPAERNRTLALYTAAMAEVAAQLGVAFVDLFTPTRSLMGNSALGELTINGIHPDDRGYWLTSRLMLASLGLLDEQQLQADMTRLEHCGDVPRSAPQARLDDAIRAKNELFFYRWRAVNGEYIYGRRKEPFGVVDFPPEMRQLEEMIQAREREIWALAKTAARPEVGGAQACTAAGQLDILSQTAVR
jgi:hypothetical protein